MVKNLWEKNVIRFSRKNVNIRTEEVIYSDHILNTLSTFARLISEICELWMISGQSFWRSFIVCITIYPTKQVSESKEHISILIQLTRKTLRFTHIGYGRGTVKRRKINDISKCKDLPAKLDHKNEITSPFR